ncbi:MAG: IS1182 family transposase [Nitrososphaerota archaeon]|nr:IS1182 family transposase [Nitrososphaerota archaeon]
MTDSDNGYVKGQDRDQLILFPRSIEEYIDEDNAVRLIDEFVDSLDLEELGFKHFESKDLGGRPAYNPYDLLKLYLYGYLNGIRSSRKLARECKRNVELMWLLRKLTPDFRTISDFRKINVDSIKKVFRKFVELCKGLDLIGGELVGIDGTKLKAWNSKSRNFNKGKLEYRIRRLELHIAEYLRQLQENDRERSGEEQPQPNTQPSSSAGTAERSNSTATSAPLFSFSPSSDVASLHARDEIRKLESKKTEYTNLLTKLRQTGRSEISFTDPECRAMKNNERIEPCYNAQVSVDSKFHLIPEYHVTNEPVDHGWLSFIAKSTKAVLGVEKLDVTADGGFFNIQAMKDCLDNYIIPYVPEYPTYRKDGKGIPSRDFQKDKFVYDEIGDRFICPARHELLFRTWDTDRYGKRMKRYWTENNACSLCSFRNNCTTNKTKGRIIERWEYEDVIDELRHMTKGEKGLAIIQKRKELCEHPFGTIKRAFNQGYLLLKGLRKVNAEVGFSVLAYNMRRVINILGVESIVRRINIIRANNL